MFTNARRAPWLPAVGAIAALLSAVVLIIPSDRPAAAPERAAAAPLRASMAQPPAAAAETESVPQGRRYIVQAQSADLARAAVQGAGGAATSDLSVIRAVGAVLDDRELAALNEQKVAGLQVYHDTEVQASSAAGALPETYYPSEVDAAELHIGGMTGRGVTVAVIDSEM